MDWEQVFHFAETITREVGGQILKDYGQVQADEKSDGSLVTRCDRWSDDRIRRALTQTFPDHGVLSEEVSHIFPVQDWCWVVDPIDGTTNFTRGIPLWAISLGLLYQGTPVFGYVYVPPLDHAIYGYWQAPGQEDGAFLNGHPIHTRAAAPAANQCFSLCARSIGLLRRPFPCKVRMLGVASYNLLGVALGSLVGAVEATPKIWDIAGVWPILQAAGASWIPLDDQPPFPLMPGHNYRDRPFPTLVVNQPDWIDQFQTLIQASRAPAPES
ncbi:inositol monophosphatase family protein [Lyngbya confervoides]|uniref:Inositol monophosphatase family protein n=1 Tax=Lyngbya confervoides BDU141951 TaxID=1574623 RepID=A0ABD4T8P5_9CYAN|nr:inositol monophosphatase family protein [Lyngbya confervoides]MCM1984814.1 inositol monophosphatase family protein [Lyngbya confervoides BDU141951]